MIHLKLTHGCGHSNGYVTATREKPDVYVDDEAVAAFCVDSGFFVIVDKSYQSKAEDMPAALVLAQPELATAEIAPDDAPDNALEKMTVKELRAYADTTGVDLRDATLKKDIITAIELAEAAENTISDNTPVSDKED